MHKIGFMQVECHVTLEDVYNAVVSFSNPTVQCVLSADHVLHGTDSKKPYVKYFHIPGCVQGNRTPPDQTWCWHIEPASENTRITTTLVFIHYIKLLADKSYRCNTDLLLEQVRVGWRIFVGISDSAAVTRVFPVCVCVCQAVIHSYCTSATETLTRTLKQLRRSRGSVLAFGSHVRGFKPDRSLSILQGEKILSTPSFGGEVKPPVPCRRFTACKRSLNVTWKPGIFRQNSSAISRPCSSTFGLLGSLEDD